MRRSPQMSESFTFDVVCTYSASFLYIESRSNYVQQEYDTTFEQIERLRELMIAFLKSERRDFLAIFDVLVVGRLTEYSHHHIYDPCSYLLI